MGRVFQPSRETDNSPQGEELESLSSRERRGLADAETAPVQDLVALDQIKLLRIVPADLVDEPALDHGRER